MGTLVRQPRIVVGIAGQICSGKSTVAEYLTQVVDGLINVSLSDLVHDLRRERRGEERRIAALRTANSTRKQRGGSHFAVAAMDKLDQGEHEAGLLTGIYCMDEVEFLRSHPRAVLVGIVSDSDDERFHRLRQRLSSRLDALSRQEFDEISRMENEGTHGSLANVGSVLNVADRIIVNNGAIADLLDQVDEFAREYFNDFRISPTRTILRTGSSEEVAMHALRDLQTRHVILKEVIEPYYLQSEKTPMEAAMAPLTASRHSVAQISNQLSTRLLDVLLAENRYEALLEFRAIQPGTSDDELALLLNDSQFGELHMRVHDVLESSASRIHEDVVKLVAQHRADDRAQFERADGHPMARLRQEGVRVLVLPAHITVLKDLQRQAASGPVPLTEYIKNERILSVDRFDGAKVSHVIHDFMDHAWLFDLLEEKGVLADHQRLFNGVGNPHLTDVFKREGEIVASIGFGVRLWAAQQVGFTPLYRLDDICGVFDRRFVAGDPMEQPALDSYRHVKRLAQNPSLRESQSLEFVFSNYMVELDEQRRKHGRIWFDDGRATEKKELDPWGVEFLSYFVAAHRVIFDSKSKHRDALLRTHILVEEFLMSDMAAQGRALHLRLADLRNPVTRNPSIPAERVAWMARNYGFSAYKPTVN